ncbi:acyl-CoA dehydrogenase family protein [Elioraea sp.]|uniref:acyl-CoA dehydrogenase family protein n=1 Tax=Elioraea sp. TaxID=2185103 RepID=UPI0025BFF0FF|nr:acyl-CoA dehydrogenase family protein [Elioraea sp.]
MTAPDAMGVADDRADGIRLLRDSAAAIVPRGGPLGRIRALRDTEAGFDRAVLGEMGAFGWLGLRVADEAGGVGLGMAELCALAEEMGHGLAPEPLVAVAAIAAPLVPEEDVIAGVRVLLPAWAERPHTLDPAGTTMAAIDGATLRVTGRKIAIPMAAGADGFLVTAREGDALSVVIVENGAPGVTLTVEATVDGGHMGTLTLEAARCVRVAEDAGPRIARLLDEAAVATAAELVGVMDRAFALTLDYLGTRQQFGKPIGSFQVLQHRAADLKIQIELSRAAVGHAAAVCDASAPAAQRSAAVSLAKARASDAAMLVTRQAIHLHGGIGYTDEADIGLFLRRAMVLAASCGTAAAHRRRYAAAAPPLDLDA